MAGWKSMREIAQFSGVNISRLDIRDLHLMIGLCDYRTFAALISLAARSLYLFHASTLFHGYNFRSHADELYCP